MRWSATDDRRYVTQERHNGEGTTFSRAVTSADLLLPIARLMVEARGKWRWIDYVAMTMSTGRGAINLYNIWKPKGAYVNLNEAFEYPGTPWHKVADYQCSYAFENRDIQETVIPSKQVRSGRKLVSAAYTATVDDIEIGWIGTPEQDKVPTPIWSKTPDRVAFLASQRLWERTGATTILRITGTNAVAFPLPQDVIETTFIATLEARARAFLNRGSPRAFVLDGEPGTGKSYAACHLARKLGLKATAINADEFSYHGTSGTAFARGADLVELLKPDVLIVNDIDRVHPDDQLELLSTFDNAKSYAKLIFATTNHLNKLIEPVRRPGRLDDVMSAPGLSVEEVLKVAPCVSACPGRLLGWPIAYASDVQKRFDVLGEAALLEIPILAKRLEAIRSEGKYKVKVRVENQEAR